MKYKNKFKFRKPMTSKWLCYQCKKRQVDRKEHACIPCRRNRVCSNCKRVIPDIEKTFMVIPKTEPMKILCKKCNEKA